MSCFRLVLSKTPNSVGSHAGIVTGVADRVWRMSF